MNQKCCTTCPHVEVNEMSDERYCSIKDYEPIKLRWHKQRPDWCPRLRRTGGRVMKKLKPIRISLNSEIAQDFTTCLDCIHGDDSEEICVLRKCVHAIRYLYDCYEKERKEDE